MSAIFDGVQRRVEWEQTQQRHALYSAAVMNRAAYHAKRFPQFSKFFAERRAKTAEDILAGFRAWSDQITAMENKP